MQRVEQPAKLVFVGGRDNFMYNETICLLVKFLFKYSILT